MLRPSISSALLLAWMVEPRVLLGPVGKSAEVQTFKHRGIQSQPPYSTSCSVRSQAFLLFVCSFFLEPHYTPAPWI